MRIRKLYEFESAHIVRGAVSRRCAYSYHGHSGKIEVFFKSSSLDDAGMIYDFGAMKDSVGKFIDMFDHAVHLWKGDHVTSLEFFKKENERWVILPCNPTAENYALLFRDCINEILRATNFMNGEGKVYCCGVRYHETRTGWAESEESDPITYKFKDIEFSPAIKAEAATSTELCKLM